MPATKFKTVEEYFATLSGPAKAMMVEMREAMAGYKSSKGAVQFPLDQPLPVRLITKIVKYRVKENETKAAIRGMSGR